MLKKITNLLKLDIWEINEKNLPKSLRRLLNFARIVSLAIRGFVEDKVQLKASALTFYSMLSIVPIIALAFGIAKGFGLEQTLQQQILEGSKSSQNEEVIKWVMNFANSMLENTKGGVVAGVGVVVLLWSVMSILGNIEASFNDIWEVKKSRNLLRKFTDYMAIMIVAPILLIASSSITVFISSTVTTIAENVEVLSFMSRFTEFLLKLSPYLIIWLIFFLLYLIMPNTKVSWKAALTAGIIAGSFFQIFEWVYINFQIGVGRYNAIYGSFAALPLFLIWLQTSWNLVLLGCEISFASQNYHRFAFEGSINNMSIDFRKKLSMLVLKQINSDFEAGNVSTKTALSQKFEFPGRLMNKIFEDLLLAKLIVEVDVEEEEGFHPAKSLEHYTVHQFLEDFDKAGVNTFPGVDHQIAGLSQNQEDLQKMKLKDI